jgi:hypothetical protein
MIINFILKSLYIGLSTVLVVTLIVILFSLAVFYVLILPALIGDYVVLNYGENLGILSYICATVFTIGSAFTIKNLID